MWREILAAMICRFRTPGAGPRKYDDRGAYEFRRSKRKNRRHIELAVLAVYSTPRPCSNNGRKTGPGIWCFAHAPTSQSRARSDADNLFPERPPPACPVP